jgi:hypothetical protein
MRLQPHQLLLPVAFLAGSPGASAAQAARASDVASPEAIVAAMYETVQRPPGGRYQWDRLRSLVLPQARLIPNTEQTGGTFRVMTVEDFIAWVDENTTIGGPDDKGFQEEEISKSVERYGDIAQVFSTYQKHFWEDAQILGRGINSIQLVWRDGRWWIVSVVWDEENGGGPIPPRYLRSEGGNR